MFKSTNVVLCIALVILSVVYVHGKDHQNTFESEKNAPLIHLPEAVTTNANTPKPTPSDVTPTKSPTPKPTPSDVTPTKSPTPKPTPSHGTPTEATSPKPTPSHCNPGDRKSVEHSCRDYLECDKTFKWANKRCSVMCQVFEPKSSKCVWNWKFPCMKAPTTVAPPTQPDSPSTPNPRTATPSASTPSTQAPVCSNGIKKPVTPNDCKHYMVCQSGQWVKTRCSFGYDFDVSKNACVWSWWAKC